MKGSGWGRGTNVVGSRRLDGGTGCAALLHRTTAHCVHLKARGTILLALGRAGRLLQIAGAPAPVQSARGCQQRACRGRPCVPANQTGRRGRRAAAAAVCAVLLWCSLAGPQGGARDTCIADVPAGWLAAVRLVCAPSCFEDLLQRASDCPHLLVPSSWEREERGGARPEPGIATGDDTALASELSSWSFTGSSTSPASPGGLGGEGSRNKSASASGRAVQLVSGSNVCSPSMPKPRVLAAAPQATHNAAGPAPPTRSLPAPAWPAGTHL